MFSSITMASSTTNPTHNVRDMSERLSQLLTLYITPVIYLYMESAHQWYLRKHAKRAAIQTGIRPASA